MPPEGNSESAVPLDPDRWVSEHGDVLFRYALARVRNVAVAEDLVQETFLAAWKAREKFTRQSAEQSWLIGILKHKIVDHFRRASREQPYDPTEPLPAELDAQFDADGHWRIADGLGPKNWGEDATAALERQEFWVKLDECLEKLPARAARAFLLRELEDLPGDEVCKVLHVTPTNLWVLLHRARMQLRHCLEKNWFGQ